VRDFVRRGRAAGVAAAIVCEPEGARCASPEGAIRAVVEASGRMAHGAMPDRGVNPIPPLAALTLRCGELEAALQAESGEHPLLGLPYVTPTVLEGGQRQPAQRDPRQRQAGPGRAHHAGRRPRRAAGRGCAPPRATAPG